MNLRAFPAVTFLLLCGCAEKPGYVIPEPKPITNNSTIIDRREEKESLDVVRPHTETDEVVIAPESRAALDARLLKAIKNLDPSGVKAALDVGANPNWISDTPRKSSAIRECIISSCFPRSERQLESQLREERCTEILNLLFGAGAGLQPSNRNALFFPISEGFTSVVELLIEKGASPRTKIDGSTSIEWAYRYGQPEVAKVLLKYGASPISEKEAALLHFIYLANRTPENHTAKMQRLLEKGIDINGKSGRGECALTEAVGIGAWPEGGKALDTIDFLLKNGADVNRQCSRGYRDIRQTPLHFIVYSTHIFFDMSSDAPHIQVAQISGELAIKKLLDAGAHVSARDELERTPLHIAAKWNNSVAARLLIEAGAKLMDKDKDGKTPLDYAEAGEMIKLLKSHGATEQ